MSRCSDRQKNKLQVIQMPHLIIEYPQDAVGEEQAESMLEGVHQAALGTGLFDESHIRIRAVPLLHYRAGGERVPFIHVQCRIHAGRDETQKRRLSEAVLAAIHEQALSMKVITVEIVEMARASYAKFVG